MANLERLLELYQTGAVPWDQADPPPEVLTTAPSLPVGRALDLGCGLGRASLFMAGLGWQVDGVDFVPQAIAEATRRADQTGLAENVRFHCGSVLLLDYLAGPYDFALAVGCAHALELNELRVYHGELLRLLKPGATYLLFAHLNSGEVEEGARRWLDETDLYRIFAEGFALERAEFGETKVGEQAPWRSAWFWFRRDSGAVKS